MEFNKPTTHKVTVSCGAFDAAMILCKMLQNIDKSVCFSGNFIFKNSDLLRVWRSRPGNIKKGEVLFNYIREKIGESNISIDYEKYLKDKIRVYASRLDAKWQKAFRSIDVFHSQNNNWLQKEIIFKAPVASSLIGEDTFSLEEEISAATPSSTCGRPRMQFSEMSDRSKRREAAKLSKSTANETEILMQASLMSARKEGKKDLVVILKKTMASPARPSKLRKLCSENDNRPIALSDEEALAFFLENNFTKRQYCNIRLESTQRKSDIFPSYMRLLAAKNSCRPNEVCVSETVAKVPLQQLLIHTAKRIIEMQREVVSSIMNRSKSNYISAELILSYGFDSSTGQAQFNQLFQKPNTSCYADSSLLATTVIPLRLIDGSGRVIWCNRTPQSTRFCRPLKLEFVKETKEVVLKEGAELRKQIEELESLTIQIEEFKAVEISFNMNLTVIDGKVLNILTETKSTQSCPICGASPTDFINIKDYKCERFKPKEMNLKYGISPLHCQIRFFEYLLHLAYKSDVKKWRICDIGDKENVKARKKRIQDDFWSMLGLRVDMPKVGGFGSTNDGNTSRRAFSEYENFSEITGLDIEVIFRLKIILICLQCQFPLQLDKFETYCFETAQRIQNIYYWCPMTPTVHKVLIHCKDIMLNTLLPVGCFGEDAAESRNKVYKSDRLDHARRTSRRNNLFDVFNRALDTSDPLISSLRINTRVNQRKRLTLPPEVIALLSCEDLPETFEDLPETTDSEENTDEPEEQNEEDNLILENELTDFL